MKSNVGKLDRTIRISLAVVIAILMITNVVEGTLLIVLGIVGALLLLTSSISFCPLYAPFRISTKKSAEG